jgi:hypothetical protein
LIQEYKYFIWTNDDTSEENVLFAPSLDVAMSFMNNLYLEIHAERRSNVERIDLVDLEGETIVSYQTHMGVLGVS